MAAALSARSRAEAGIGTAADVGSDAQANGASPPMPKASLAAPASTTLRSSSPTPPTARKMLPYRLESNPDEERRLNDEIEKLVEVRLCTIGQGLDLAVCEAKDAVWGQIAWT